LVDSTTTVDHIEGDPTVARTNPIGKIKDTAVDTLKGSVSATQGAVGQVVGKALGTVETVTSLIPGRRGHGKDDGRAAGGDPADRTEAPVEQAGSRKVHGDALAPVKKAPAKKAPAKKAPAQKAPAKKAPAKKAPAKKAPAPDVTAQKAPAQKATASTTVPDEVTPADVAKQVAKQAPTKKSAAKKATKKAAPRPETPAADAPAAEVVYSTGPETNSPAPTASSASSSSDEPLIDPGTVKAVASEAETLARAADPDKG
jgi:heparin binding hemagglutinin HbhA